jgi:microcystin-dependent protein
MSKITRVTQLLFGSTGSASKFGQVGSINTTKTNTKDPATIQALPAFLSGLESIVKSGTYKIAIEDLNSLFLLAYYQLSYLMQEGVAEYDAITVYYTNSYCKYNGTLYQSLVDSNTGNTPSSSPSSWVSVSSSPAGATIDFAGPVANIPGGYLLCDGSAVSRTTYAGLYAAIGTGWGVGDGSTTFNLPNLMGKTTVGYNASDTDFNAVGKTGGEKTHQLTITEMPAHTHLYDKGQQGDTTSGVPENDPNGRGYVSTASSSTGGDGAHNNMQPYGVVLKLIKY